MSKPLIKVFIIDDHQLIIDGIKSVLEEEVDMMYCGGANNMNEALDFVRRNTIDVVLVDVNMPGGSGIETALKLKGQSPDIKIIALTMHEDIQVIKEMIEAGASGYILKRSNMNEVLDAIRVVYNNERYLGRDIQAVLMDSLNPRVETGKQGEVKEGVLTTREREILQLIAKEYSNEQIAQKLFISERTVETHRRNIFTKTKMKSIVGLIKYAFKEGLITNDGE